MSASVFVRASAVGASLCKTRYKHGAPSRASTDDATLDAQIRSIKRGLGGGGGEWHGGGGLRRWQRGIKPDRFHEWMTPQGVPIKKKDPPQKGINATAKIDSDTVRMKKIASIPSRNLANLSKTK